MMQDYDQHANLSIRYISGKRKIVRALIKWKKNTEQIPRDRYLKVLWEKLDKMDLDKLLVTLDEIETWCDYRNECIHAVMNKNMDSLQEEIEQRAKEGMDYARLLDAQVKILKRGNTVRQHIV